MAQDSNYLSIGEVLTEVQVEFPELSISKIRFLENQGLIDPERTPSGYRKFYQRDIDRLRTILQMQRETYMPLKRIRDALVEFDSRSHQSAGAMDEGEVSSSTLSDQRNTASSTRRVVDGDGLPLLKLLEAEVESESDVEVQRHHNVDSEVVAESVAPVRQADDHLGDPSFRHLSTEEQLERISESLLTRYSINRLHSAVSSTSPSHPGQVEEGRDRDSSPQVFRGAFGADSSQLLSGAVDDAEPGEFEESEGSTGTVGGANPKAVGDSGQRRKSDPNHASLFSLEELARLSGAKISEIREIEEFGLIESKLYAGERYYAQIDFEIVQVVTVFRKYGVQARHLKMYKISAEREVGFMEQILSPILRQRNPSARTRATEQLSDLKMLGGCLRGYYMEKMLAKYLDLS